MKTVGLQASLSIREIVEAMNGRLVAGVAPALPAEGVSIDSRTLKSGDAFFAIRGPHFDGHGFLSEAASRGARFAVVERDVASSGGLPLVRVEDTTRALGDLARHVRLAAAIPVVGVTGSMGKTTTKDMLAALLETRGSVLKTEGNLNNAYGLPLTILRLGAAHWAAALEMGMSAPGEMRVLSAIARPDVALITNVAPVHLEFFPSVEAIADAKAEILEGLSRTGVAVLNGDDPLVRRIGERWGGRVVWFGKRREFDVAGENWRGTPHGMRFDLRAGGAVADVALPFAGPHFMHDFLAAAAAAHHLGIDLSTMAEVASGLQPAAHRGVVLRLKGGVTLFDDCYNSNPQALEAAVVALGLQTGARRVAFVGDMLELGPAAAAIHRETAARIASKVDVLVAVGEFAESIADGARGVVTHRFKSAAAAAHDVSTLVEDGDAVLVKGSRGVRMEAIVNAIVARRGKAGV